MQTFSKKFLATLLVVCMLMCLMPFGAFAADETKILGQQLFLGDDLAMHFFVSVEEQYKSSAVVTVEAGGTCNEYAIGNMTAAENGAYDCYIELGAPQMTEDILVTVTAGETQLLQATYSIQDYAHYLLEGNYTNETKALVKEMLNYGAKAQLYFGHKTQDLANVGYEIETQAAISTDAPAVTVSDKLAGISYHGSSMVFESKIAIRHYFYAPNGVTGYTFTVNGNTYLPDLKNGYYYIEVSGINPDQMDEEMAVSVTKDDGSLSFSYSPMAYITRMYNKAATSEELKALLVAANGYFVAAEVFTGVAENRTGNLIQFNTNLPATTALKDFLATDNGCNLLQSGDQQVGWIGMADAEGTIVLTFNFNGAFSAGQSYTLAAGSVFGFTDGNSYTMVEDVTLYYDGSAWTAEEPAKQIGLTYRYGAANLIQFNTNLPATTALKDFLATDNGCQIVQSGDQQVGYISMINADDTIVLTFNFNADFAYGQSYTLTAGSVFAFTDGTSYILDKNYTFYWDGAAWSETEPAPQVDVLDESNFTGGKVITFADLPVDSRDPAKIQEYKELGFNTSLLTEDHTGAQGPDECYTVTMETENAPADGLNFAYRYGTSTLIQVNTNLPASTPIANFTADQNGCSIDQSGNTVQWVGWIGMANADGTIVLTFNFNNAFTAGQSYVLPKSNFNDQLTSAVGSSISFDNYPFTHDQGFNLSSFETLPGIEENYLLNCLIAARVAGQYDFGMCVQTFHATDLLNKTDRDIVKAEEVSFQIYTGMAMGVDLFEYFAYNSNGDFNAIMNTDGSKRIYDIVKEGNQALCFADVVNSFTWNGIVTSLGSTNSDNSAAFTKVENMILTNTSNGVLNSYSSTDDAIIGCFTKGDLNGYMLVNYNDPVAVTGDNSVTVSFENCTRARVYTEVDGVLTSTVVDLTDGSYTVTLAPGGGCFIIPA